MLAIVLLPSLARLSLVADEHPYYSVGIGLADVAAAVLLAFAIPAVARRIAERRIDALGTTALAFGAIALLSFALHPSPQGAQTLFRLASAVAIAIAILDVQGARERRLLLFAVAITAVTQTLLAIAQVAVGDLLVAYEHPPVIKAGPFIRPAGSLPNGFVLAGYALVTSALLAAPAIASGAGAVRSVLVALAAAPVGLSFSRAAALGAALAAAPLAPGALRGARAQRIVLAAFLIGVGLPALVTREGWLARSDEYPALASADRRLELIVQTLPLLARDPLLGIGPGNTVAELRERKAREPGSVDLIQPPHDVPYLIALETGIPGGLVASALLVLIGLRAWRLGPERMMAFLALLPYLALDNYPWTAATGLPLLGLWAGASLATRVTDDPPA